MIVSQQSASEPTLLAHMRTQFLIAAFLSMCCLCAQNAWAEEASNSNVDRSLPIRVVNPRKLPDWKLPAERIAIGEGYKPCMVMLPDGELVMVALFSDPISGGKLREWTGLWRSKDGGRTWTEHGEIKDMIGREQWLTCTSDGVLLATCHLLPQDIHNKNGHTHSYNPSIDRRRPHLAENPARSGGLPAAGHDNMFAERGRIARRHAAARSRFEPKESWENGVDLEVA